MQPGNAAQLTAVVTTTPTRVHGLEQLNAALADGYRIAHLASLGYSEPGTDASWPEGHVSTLLLLEATEHRETGRETHTRQNAEGENISRSGDLPPKDLPWTDYAI